MLWTELVNWKKPFVRRIRSVSSSLYVLRPRRRSGDCLSTLCLMEAPTCTQVWAHRIDLLIPAVMADGCFTRRYESAPFLFGLQAASGQSDTTWKNDVIIFNRCVCWWVEVSSVRRPTSLCFKQPLISAGRIKLMWLKIFYNPLFLCFHFFSPSSVSSLTFISSSPSPYSFFCQAALHLSPLFLYLILYILILGFRVLTQSWLPRPCILSAFHMKKGSRIHRTSPCRGVNLGSLTPLTICFMMPLLWDWIQALWLRPRLRESGCIPAQLREPCEEISSKIW